MKRQWKLSVSTVVFLTLVVTVSVAEDTKTGDSSWKGNVELGIVNTTGNTETETINVKAKAATEREKWLHTISLESLTSSDQGITTAERYVVNGQSDYKFG